VVAPWSAVRARSTSTAPSCYAVRRDARLVVLSGAATERMFELGNPQGLLAVATTPAEAEALLS
jgi:hypothetical protein